MTSKQEQFIQDLVQFYRNRGINHANSSQFVARINGKVINLCELYTYVLEYGGSYKVNQTNSWDEIYCKLSKAKCIGANFAVALRQIYNRYLLQYEKSSSGNFTSEPWNEDEDDENLYYNHHNSSSLSSKHHLDNVIESSGQVHNDTKLYCSLLSGLPNELNFAFNVSTILSNCNRFDWTNDYKFVNVLFDSMKNYCCVCDQFEEDISFGRSLAQDGDEVLMLRTFINSSINNANNLKSNSKPINNENNKRSQSTNLANICLTKCSKQDEIEFIERNCNCYRQFWNQICSDEEALHLVFEEDDYEDIDFNLPYVFKDFPVHLLNKIEQRVELIAGILRNISFTYDQNNANNISMIPLLKFLVLLMRCDNIRYLNLTLDILSNISPSLSFSSLKPYPEVYYSLLNIILKNVAEIALTSNNIHDTTKSFEIMARFISSLNNESNLLLEAHFKHSELYQRITQLLTCQYDISLILALLEFCLTLSENRPYLLVQNESKTFIKILVNLLNCEATQHFTTGALKKVKLIDERPRNEIMQTEMKNQVTATTNNAVLRTSTNMPSNAAVINQAASNLQNNILDNEAYAINWLRTSYDESQHGCSLKVHDIYAEYVKFCCRNSRKNVIAAQSFNFLIKRCFPLCSINVSQGTVDGLAIKGHTSLNSVELQTKQANNTTVTTQNSIQPPQLMSPILKAHLSTPPKNNSASGANSPVQNSNDLSQTSQSATTNTSTLIKSLLANKLRNNQQSLSSPNSPNNNKPSTNSNQAVVVQNDNIKQDQNSPKSVVFSTNSTTFALTPNPTTTFAITSNASSTFSISPNPTTTFAIASNSGLNLPNNFIVQNNALQQQQQQQQQFLLVRTIITAPGQQNPNSPVRLLLPASMIQQRFPAPATLNGMLTNSLPNNSIQSVSAQAPQVQTQLSIPQSNLPINSLNTITSSVATQPTSVPNRSSITNSPLLNVLLDKGKLPEFATNNSNPSPNCLSNQNVQSNNTPVSNNQSPIIQQNSQPKMYILTTKQNSNAVTNSNIQSNETLNNSTGDAISPNPGLVNGDLKALVSNTNSPIKNNAIIKHALETTNNKPAKRLKKHQSNNLINEHKPVENNFNNNSTNDDHNHVPEVKPQNSIPLVNNISAVNNNINNAIGNTNLMINNLTDQMKPVTIQVTVESPIVSNNTNAVTVTSTLKPELPLEYECQWNNCLMKFARPSDVFYHVHSQHIIISSCPDIMNCLWGGPEGRGPGCLSKRPKLSLLTHLQDFHCNTTVLKQELLRKKQLSVMGTSNITLPQPPAHPGYSQNAAMLAIRRYSTNYLDQQPSSPITPLTPLTVSIRLTSALILRNLAQRSHSIKKSLEMFEPQLCEISIAEGRDESRTIAQCLAVINDRK